MEARFAEEPNTGLSRPSLVRPDYQLQIADSVFFFYLDRARSTVKKAQRGSNEWRLEIFIDYTCIHLEYCFCGFIYRYTRKFRALAPFLWGGSYWRTLDLHYVFSAMRSDLFWVV